MVLHWKKNIWISITRVPTVKLKIWKIMPYQQASIGQKLISKTYLSLWVKWSNIHCLWSHKTAISWLLIIVSLYTWYFYESKDYKSQSMLVSILWPWGNHLNHRWIFFTHQRKEILLKMTADGYEHLLVASHSPFWAWCGVQHENASLALHALAHPVLG